MTVRRRAASLGAAAVAVVVVGASTAWAQPRPSAEPRADRVLIYGILANGLTSNLEFDEKSDDAIGTILGAGVRVTRDDFEFAYEVAQHAYTAETERTRLSQLFTAAYDWNLPGRWHLDLAGEFAIRGSSEDRDIVDRNVAISPRLAYRFTSRHRLRFFTIHRLKRYNQDPEDNTVKHYVGAEFRHTTETRRYWEVGGRLETNDKVADRGDYRRTSYWLEHGVPITARNTLRTRVAYRVRRYSARVVQTDAGPVLRTDRRLTPGITWTRQLGRRLKWRLDYEFEANSSNDPGREFSAHLAWSRLTFGW